MFVKKKIGGGQIALSLIYTFSFRIATLDLYKLIFDYLDSYKQNFDCLIFMQIGL